MKYNKNKQIDNTSPKFEFQIVDLNSEVTVGVIIHVEHLYLATCDYLYDLFTFITFKKILDDAFFHFYDVLLVCISVSDPLELELQTAAKCHLGDGN